MKEYSLGDAIGFGASSVVYSAINKNTRATVALKMLRPTLVDSTLAVSDFLQEPRILLGLKHPNIIRCFDFFFAHSTWWIVLEHVSGGALKSVIKQRQGEANTEGRASSVLAKNSNAAHRPLEPGVPVRLLEAWFSQVADALRYLHGRRLIHRDVKPGNILIDGRRAVLADFGFCCGMVAAKAECHRICGTPEYMSNDAFHGIYTPDNDWYALDRSRQRVLAQSAVGRGLA